MLTFSFIKRVKRLAVKIQRCCAISERPLRTRRKYCCYCRPSGRPVIIDDDDDYMPDYGLQEAPRAARCPPLVKDKSYTSEELKGTKYQDLDLEGYVGKKKKRRLI